jgi:hypothetical protein
MIHSLSEISCYIWNQSLTENSGWFFLLLSFELSRMLKLSRVKDGGQNLRFVELTEDEGNILQKIGKGMVAIRSRYFHLVFERIFFDVPFLRSPRYKLQIWLQQKTWKVWRPNAYASDYINALLRTALKNSSWHWIKINQSSQKTQTDWAN